MCYEDIRGHTEAEGNLRQFLSLCSEDCDGLNKWLSHGKYLSHDIVNEQVELLGQTLLCNMLKEIRAAQWFRILADELRDISNQEQLGITIRWVDDQLEINEDFIGLINLTKADANSVKNVIKDILLRTSLPLSSCCGQGYTYDGASTMKGAKNGVAAQLCKEELRAIYVHCLAHCLNLVLQDTSRACTIIRDVPELCMGIAQLINWSPKRLALFLTKQHDTKIGVRSLCPTRWTVRTGGQRRHTEELRDTPQYLGRYQCDNTR